MIIEGSFDDDFLSDLPLSIIHSILALIPITDAVRTCILSKQWRYKWTSLHHLVFDDTIKCVDRTKSKQCLKNFVANVLFHHQGPIQKFHLSNRFLNSCSDADRLLLYLSTKEEISELHIENNAKDGLFKVHSSLYSCRKLTHLRLFDCELARPPPTFNGFLCLRSLVLCDVKVPFEALVSLVSNSPLLENLKYYDFLECSEFRISALNLKCFEFGGDFAEIALHAPLVTRVSIMLSKDSFENSSVCNYSEFLGGFANLEKLICHMFVAKYLSIGIESYDRSLVFHHLKIINLFHVNCHDVKEVSVLVHLIRSAPNLHEFYTSFLFGKESSEASPISFSDFGCTPHFTFEKLRIVKIRNVVALPYQMELIEYLLKNSPTLEEMNIYYSYKLKLLPEKIFNLKTKLRTYGRASPNADIFLDKSRFA